MDWRSLFLRYNSLYYTVYYMGSACMGATLYNLGSTPVDASITSSRRWRRQAYQFQTYKFCADEATRAAGRAGDAPPVWAEVGAGMGAGARFMKEHYGASVIALEKSTMARALSFMLHRVRARHALAPDLPLADASVDAIITVDTSHMFPADAFFREARRALRPGGRLIVADLRKRSPERTRLVFEEAFTAAGFTDWRIEDMTESVMRACEEDAGRRRRLVRYLPRRLREAMSYALCLPESEKFQEFREKRRSYVFASGAAPAA